MHLCKKCGCQQNNLILYVFWGNIKHFLQKTILMKKNIYICTKSKDQLKLWESFLKRWPSNKLAITISQKSVQKEELNRWTNLVSGTKKYTKHSNKGWK